MADRYAGAWRTRILGTTDEIQPLGAADSQRHMMDYGTGLHSVDDTATTRRMVQSSHALDAPPPELLDATDSSQLLATDPKGVPLDHESRGHGDDVEWSENNNSSDRVQPTRLHFRDVGSMWARRIRQPRMPQWDEKFSTPRVHAHDTAENSDRQRFLGTQFAGARPENNPLDTVQRERGDPKAAQSPPVGWRGEPRIGFRIFRFDERRFPMHYVRHDSRWLPLHLARTAQDAPQPLQANQYVSPYATLASTRLGNYVTPMIRRQPNPWDQTVITDGSTDGAEHYNSWGL